MFHKNFLEALNLQLFADGEGGTIASGESGATEADAASHSGVKNPLANVKYGIQETEEPAAEVPQKKAETKPQLVDRRTEFEKLIKGDFKDEYEKNVKDIVQRRLKGSKDTERKYKALTPTIELLSKKYGVDAEDVEALNRAIEDDDAYYEQEALEKNMTVQQLKEIRKMQRENAELKRQKKEEETQKKAVQLYNEWITQAEDLKSVYPSLSLENEVKNSKFVELLRVPGVDVRTAYEIIHKDEIMAGAMQYAAKTAEQKIANNIVANGMRPTENGLSSQSAATVKSDVSQLSKADRREIIQRVARGEKIRF